MLPESLCSPRANCVPLVGDSERIALPNTLARGHQMPSR
jgi:hypothetical protein